MWLFLFLLFPRRESTFSNTCRISRIAARARFSSTKKSRRNFSRFVPVTLMRLLINIKGKGQLWCAVFLLGYWQVVYLKSLYVKVFWLTLLLIARIVIVELITGFITLILLCDFTSIWLHWIIKLLCFLLLHLTRLFTIRDEFVLTIFSAQDSLLIQLCKFSYWFWCI